MQRKKSLSCRKSWSTSWFNWVNVVWNKVVLIVLSSALASACGYHLRGSYELPKSMQNVFIEGGSATFHDQLKSALKTASGKLVDSPDKADVTVKVYQDNIERRVLSLSERGRSNDIELAGHLEYELLGPSRTVLVERTPIDFRREYFNDQQDVIAKDNEESIIRKEMYQQVVRAVLNRGRAAMAASAK